MKKIVKAFAVLATIALLGTAVSCSNDDGESDPFAKPTDKPADQPSGGGTTGDTVASFATDGIGNVIEFKVTDDSTSTSNKITLKYLRSAPSAKEKIVLTNAEYRVQHNSGAIVKKTGDLTFALNNYGSCFAEGFEEGKPVTDEMRKASGKYKENSTELKDPQTDASEYQCELSYAEALKKGDTVKFQLVSGGFVIESGATATKTDIMPKLKAILIDADPKVDYYKELFTKLSKEEGVYPKVVKAGAQIDDGQATDHGLLDADFNTMGWAGQATIGADKFADVAVGDKITVTYKMNNDGDTTYHMYQLCHADDVEVKFVEVSGLNEDGEKTYIVKAVDVAALKANGMKIQGNSVTITKVVLTKGDGTVPEEPAAPTAVAVGAECLVDPYKPFVTAWNDEGLLDKVVFTNAGTGSVITITLEALLDGTETQLKFITKGWADRLVAGEITGGAIANTTNPKKEDGKDDDTYGTLVPTATTITYAPTTAEWTAIKAKGFAIAGNGAKVTSVKFSAPTETQQDPVTPPAGESVTVTNCKAFTVNVDKSVMANDLRFRLQIANDGTQDANGLKITVTNLKVSVKANGQEQGPFEYATAELAPDQYATPNYSLSVWNVVPLEKATGVEIKSGDVLIVQVLSATIDNKAKAGDIQFTMQRNGGTYSDAHGSWAPIAPDADLYQKIFTAGDKPALPFAALSGVTIPEGATVLYKATDAANSIFKTKQTWWNNEGALATAIDSVAFAEGTNVIKVTVEDGASCAFGEMSQAIAAGQKLVISVYTANGLKFKPVAPDQEFAVTGKAEWQLFELPYEAAATLSQLGFVGTGTGTGKNEHYIDAVYLVAGAAPAVNNVVWEGTKALGWGDNDGIMLPGTAFDGKTFDGLRITVTATQGGFKIAVCSPWKEIAFDSCSAGTDEAKQAIYPATDGETTVAVTIPAADIAGMKASGIKIMGDATITVSKVELAVAN